MKKRLHMLLFALGVFAACYHPKQPAAETSFFRDFSLSSIIQGMRVGELQPQSGDDGKSEAFGDPIRRRRNADITYLIVDQFVAKFDETKFLNQLGLEIEKRISESGLRIDSRSSAADNFQVDYSQRGQSGSLDITCARTGTNQFKMWAVIREEAQEKTR